MSVSEAYICVVRRNAFSRIFAGVLSVWLAICLAEPAQLHTCAMHGDLAMQSHGIAAHHGTMHGHSHNQSGDDKAKQCSCIGDCSAGRTLVGPTSVSVSFAATTIETSSTPFGYESPAISAPHFFLPFPNGPPRTSSRA